MIIIIGIFKLCLFSVTTLHYQPCIIVIGILIKYVKYIYHLSMFLA